MRRLTFVLCLILCLTFFVCACRDNAQTEENSTETNTQNPDETDNGNTNDTGEYRILMYGGNEITEGMFTYTFGVFQSDNIISDPSLLQVNVSIVNKDGDTVYNGTPYFFFDNEFFKIQIPRMDMAPGPNNMGTATITVRAGKTAASDSEDLYKLPFGFTGVTLSGTGETYVTYGSSGDMRVTFVLTDICFCDDEDITYGKESLSFKVSLKGKITSRGEMYASAKTPSISLVGIAEDGTTELFSKIVSCTPGENDEFTGTCTIRDFVPGTLVTIGVK